MIGTFSLKCLFICLQYPANDGKILESDNNKTSVLLPCSETVFPSNCRIYCKICRPPICMHYWWIVDGLFCLADSFVIAREMECYFCDRCYHCWSCLCVSHYYDVIMGVVASQITSLTYVYSTVYSDADKRKHRSSASLAFVWGTHRGPVSSSHKWPVTRKMFPFDDIITNNKISDHWVARLDIKKVKFYV